MTGDKELKDDALEALFADAKRDAPALPGAVRARILADAEDVQTGLRPPVVSAGREPSSLKRLWTSLGGWGGLGGLAMATVAGLWIGFANPTLVAPQSADADLAALVEEGGFGDIFLGDSLFFEEG